MILVEKRLKRQIKCGQDKNSTSSSVDLTDAVTGSQWQQAKYSRCQVDVPGRPSGAKASPASLLPKLVAVGEGWNQDIKPSPAQPTLSAGPTHYSVGWFKVLR